MIQSVSHDLRTPLATIRTPWTGSRARRSGWTLHSARSSSNQFGTSFSGSSATSRMSSTCHGFRRERRHPQAIWTVDALADGARRVARRRARAGRGAFRSPPIRTDAAQVQRALVNVLENALKFSPPDTTVILRAERRGDDVSFASTTRGRGSSPRTRPGSSSPSITRAERRLGARARDRARVRRANGGRIWVEQAASGGASFVLALPVAELAPVAT